MLVDIHGGIGTRGRWAIGVSATVDRLTRYDQRENRAPVVKPPFLVRENPDVQESYFVLREGIPDTLLPSLLDWSLEHYTTPMRGIIAGSGRFVNQNHLNRLERIIEQKVLPDEYRRDDEALERIFAATPVLHIQAIDVALRWATIEWAEELGTYLDEARSVYCVRKDEDGDLQLQFRQSAEMTELIETEANQSGYAATHLRNAWSKCFDLNPDTKGAIREAVEAVEVAAKPVVTPTDSKPSLGKMCGAISNKPEKWETDSEFDRSVESVLRMMELVWNEGRFRHGDENAPKEVSQEAAEMIVQTAVLLVGWFRSGRIRLNQ